ncbi:hypothetical protein NKJ06_16445 [Mesorhizobium sp. M0293]
MAEIEKQKLLTEGVLLASQKYSDLPIPIPSGPHALNAVLLAGGVEVD